MGGAESPESFFGLERGAEAPLFHGDVGGCFEFCTQLARQKYPRPQPGQMRPNYIIQKSLPSFGVGPGLVGRCSFLAR